MRAEHVIQQHLDQAGRQWKWFRFLRHSATLGIIVTSILLLLGVLTSCGWLTSEGFVAACLVLLVAGGTLTLSLVGLIVATSQPKQDELARAIERAHPALMDRLNTLIFLSKLRQTPRVGSYYRRIAGQTRSTLAEEAPVSHFPSARPVARLCALAALVIVTAWFYLQFRPLGTLAAASGRLHDDHTDTEETFEIPPAEPEPEPAEEAAPWGEVCITEPGRDLTLTEVESIPLHIEASASEPVKSVQWYTSLNGGDARSRPLPSPTDPRYAVYDLTIEPKKLGLSDWDVLEYYAKATTERGDSFVSETYFVKIQPFREELCNLPGGQDGKCYSALSQMSGLIECQQQVIREAHRQQYGANETPETQGLGPEQLAEMEDEIAASTEHLGARLAGEFGSDAVEKPLSHLDRAEASLAEAAEAFRDRSVSEAQPQARASLAEMVEARKQLQKCIDGNQRTFAERDEGDSASESELAASVKKMSEFCDKAKAAVEVVRELAQRQRTIAKGAGLDKVSHRTTFTTGLDSRNRPADSIKEISMRQKRVYLYTSWRGLSEGDHDHVCTMYDGAGKIVAQPKMTFTANPSVCNTWSWHDFDQSKDDPGTWKFEVYLDDQKVIEKTLEVRPVDEQVRPRPVQPADSNRTRSVEMKKVELSETAVSLGEESMSEAFSAWMDEPAFETWLGKNLEGIEGLYVSAVEGRLSGGVEQFRVRLARSSKPMRWFWWYGIDEQEYQEHVVELTQKDTFTQDHVQIFIDAEGRAVYQAVFKKDLNRTSRAKPLQRKEDDSFSLIGAALYGQLAADEDALREDFGTFESQYAEICQSVPKECTAARQELERASEALWNQHDKAQQRTILAAARLDRLAEALAKQTSTQQMVDAYKLKSMLDEQIRSLEKLEQQPDAMTPQELERACRNMKKVTSELKKIAENRPTSKCFGQKLREALSDENKRDLDSQCDSLCSAQRGEARKQAAKAAKSGLQKVSQAFTESQPHLLAEAQKNDALRPTGKQSLERGIGQLEDLLASSRDGRRMSPAEADKLRQEAMNNIERAIEDLNSGSASSGNVYKALREYYAPGVTVEPEVIERLIAQLENLSVEVAETQGEEPGEPEIRYIDPGKLPQAYRERIRKYYEKLSER